MKAYHISIAMIALLLTLTGLPALSLEPDTRGDYPQNHEIQDYEPSADEQWDLDIAQDDSGRFYAVWTDNRDRLNEVRFSKSMDGSSWGDGQMNNNDLVLNDKGDTLPSNPHPTIAAVGNNVHCVWLDMFGGDRHLRIISSNNTGSSWSNSKAIENGYGDITEPYLRTTPQGTLCIVYVEERERMAGGGRQKDIMFMTSSDGGGNFTEPIRLNTDPTDEDQLHPRLSISDEGVIGVVWQDLRNGNTITNENSDIYFTYSVNQGASFSTDVKASVEEEELKQENPDIVFSGEGDCMIAWEENGDRGWRIKYTIGWLSEDSWNGTFGEAWRGTEENLSIVKQSMPRIGYVDGAFALAWTELDTRNFHLIREGYISRGGDITGQNHIIDNTISLGNFTYDLDIPIAEMYKYTNSVHGYGDRAQVFWIDHRTDPNPGNLIAEDGDPYTATANTAQGYPLSPLKPELRVVRKTWDTITLDWPISHDIEFEGYYLAYSKGEMPILDRYVNDHFSKDRFENGYRITGLDPNSEYTIRMMTGDGFGHRSFSSPINITTGRNSPPVIHFLEPDGNNDEADTFFTIRWTCSDNEENANVTISYDEDTDPRGQVVLYEGHSDDNGGYGEILWNTSGLENGAYVVNATIWDMVSRPITVYSYAIIVTHPQQFIHHPKVVSAYVSDGGKETAFVDTTVIVNFDKNISIASVDQDSFYLLDGSQMKVIGAISQIGAGSIEFVPDRYLKFNMDHTLYMTPAVTDMEGNGLDGMGIGRESSYSFSFRTRADTQAPIVRERSPESGGAPLWTDISVRFDLPMDETSIDEQTLILRKIGGDPISLEVSYDPATFTIAGTLNAPLKEMTTYNVWLSRSITSFRSVPLGWAISWNFTTGTPNLNIDTDGDGTPDDLDPFPGDASESSDLDGDGIGDNRDLDDDGDGMDDIWEDKHGLDPRDPRDAGLDPDGDGKTNLEEYIAHTDPNEKKSEMDPIVAWAIVGIVASTIIVGAIAYGLVQRRKFEEKQSRDFFREE